VTVSDATRAKVMQHFPGFAYLLSNAEIGGVLERAVNEEWTPDTFEANLRATAWWRTQTDKVRARSTLEQTDPATASEAVNKLKAQIRSTSATYGTEMTEERAGALAWTAWRGGWDESAIRNAIAVDTRPNDAAQVDVRGLARAYMVTLPDATVSNLTRRVFAGELDAQAVEAFMVEQSTARFPALAAQIKQGIRPHDYFGGHRQIIANLTGQDPEAVDLVADPTWQRVISTADGQTLRPMTLDETTRYTRTTSQFQKSRRGQAEQASFVQEFARAVGGMS
jgi:hypothetical protein